MKKTVFYIMLACLLAYPVSATYYEITTDIYTPGLTLQTGDTLYMTDGGFGSLTLLGNSDATVEGTSALVQFFGGIWKLNLAENSRLDFSGGELGTLDIVNNARATLSGGSIVSIESGQTTTKWDDDNQVWVPNPHITIIYSGDLPVRNPTTNILTGLWGGGDPFSIQLVDVSGYSPAINNIQFQLIPEPATLFLLGLGGFWLRKRML